jgi:phage terminase large subunit-like protein
MGRRADAEASLDESLWNFACPDWEQRLREGRSLVPDLPLDQGLADQAVTIFNKLRLPDVPGQPPMAEAAGEWARDMVRAAFGSLNRTTRRRMIRKILGMVPKKNSKTTNGAAISLTAALMNDRPNAELQMIGPTQEIANVAFDQAWGMIDADPEGYLPKRFLVRDHIKSIEDRLNGSVLKIKTFDMKVTTGSKPIFVLLDEIHLMALISYATRVFGQIEGNMLANEESLLIGITTQADDVPAGLWRQELQYARGIRDGRITERVRTLPLLYEFPETLQTAKRPGGGWRWEDPSLWPMVLPNLGKSITIERLIDDYSAAKEKGDAELRRWASQHLNIEIGLGLHADRWRGADYWEAAVDQRVKSLEDLINLCEVICIGVDGGGLDDLLGFSAIGRIRGSTRWASYSKGWVEADLLKNRPEIAERLRDFEAAGDLVIYELQVSDLDGDEDTLPPDLEELAQLILQVHAAGLLPEAAAVGLDLAGVAIRLLAEALVKRGLTEAQLTGVAQGYRLMGAIQLVERKLKERTLVHAEQAAMDWNIGNAKAEMKGSAVLITKETAGKAKIDMLMSLFDAAELMARNPQPAPKKQYQMLFVG